MNVFERIGKVIESWGLAVPIMGEPNPDAYGRVADALEWADRRLKALEVRIKDLEAKP